MSLCNIYGYLTTKTIKLSDSYQVRLKLDDADFWNDNSPKENRYALKITKPENGEIELCECTSVTLPSYKPKEEIFEYGNNSKTIIYMDPTSLGDLEIELIEHYTKNGTLAITNLVNLFLSKLFDEDTFEYKLTDYIPELTVYVFNNIFTTVYLKYVFKELKLVDYTKFDLDYSSADIAKWTLKFSYRSFYVLSGEEEAYAKETKNEEPLTAQESPAPTVEVTAPVIEETNPDSPLQETTSSGETPAENVTDITVDPSSQDVALPDVNNTALQNEFNSAGEVPTGQDTVTDVVTEQEHPETNTDNEMVLDNVLIQSNEKNNPVDLNSLSPEDRTDELAYRMMRGELDNGKPRYDKTYDAGYTEEERAKAQSIVNEKDWEGLKERHDARVLNIINSETEHANNENTDLPNETIVTIGNSDNKPITTAKVETSVSEEPMKPVKLDTPVTVYPEQQENNTSNETKISEEKLANAGISKADPNEKKYYGLTSTQWGEIAANQDIQDGLGEDNKGLNYNMLYGNGEIEKDKFKTAYENYMSKNNKPATQEQTASTEQPKPEPEPVVEQIKSEPEPEPVKEQPKPKVQQNPDLITLTEADIDKYVPFLYKSMARGYFNKFKNEEGTLTIVANEQMINDNVPALFRSTAKNILKEYRADHPIEN